MDKDYINNISESPYVDEGAFQRLKSKAAQGVQAGAAMMGHQIERPYHTKIKSLWEGFSKKLVVLLKDIKNNIDPLIRNRSGMRLTAKQNSLLKKFSELYYSFVIPRVKAYQLGGALKEALGDMFKRDMALNNALASNDPDKILNAYKEKIQALYNGFLNDASKVTGIPRDSVAKVASEIYPPQKYKNTIQKLQSFAKIPSLTAKAAPGATTPVTATPQAAAPPTAQPTTTPVPTSVSNPATPSASIVQQMGTKPVAAPATATTPTATSPMTTGVPTSPVATTRGVPSGVPSGGQKLDYDPNDMAFLIDNVIDIIIDTVRSDVSHAEPFLGPKQRPLPQTWQEPSITKEAVDPTTKPKKSNEPEDEEEDQLEGQFLYNFHSKWRKKHEFSIEIGRRNITLPSGKRTELIVFWKTLDKENNIFVQTKGDNGKVTTALLFKFYDHEVDPRTKYGKNFDVRNMLTKAHPHGNNLLDPNVVDPKILNSIDSKKENLLRALWATSIRKAMEFKSKQKGGLKLTADKDGNVTIHDINGKPVGKPLTPDQVKSKIYSGGNPKAEAEAEKWINSLNSIGYFDDHPEMKPESLKGNPKFRDALLAFLKLGYKEEESEKILTNAWNRIISVDKKDPNKIDTNDFVKYALKKEPEKNITGSEETPPENSPAAPASKEPESAKVSNEPVVPVSKDKPEPGKIEPNESGEGIKWTNHETGETLPLNDREVFYYMTKSPEFKKSLEAAGLYDKYVDKLKSFWQAKKEREKTTEMINPFQKSNFLS